MIQIAAITVGAFIAVTPWHMRLRRGERLVISLLGVLVVVAGVLGIILR